MILLIWLAFNKLLKFICILAWGVRFIPCNVFTQIEKDDDLVEII